MFNVQKCAFSVTQIRSLERSQRRKRVLVLKLIRNFLIPKSSIWKKCRTLHSYASQDAFEVIMFNVQKCAFSVTQIRSLERSQRRKRVLVLTFIRNFVIPKSLIWKKYRALHSYASKDTFEVIMFNVQLDLLCFLCDSDSFFGEEPKTEKGSCAEVDSELRDFEIHIGKNVERFIPMLQRIHLRS